MNETPPPGYHELVWLLARASVWLNDYDLRMNGSAVLADEIDDAIDAAADSAHASLCAARAARAKEGKP